MLSLLLIGTVFVVLSVPGALPTVTGSSCINAACTTDLPSPAPPPSSLNAVCGRGCHCDKNRTVANCTMVQLVTVPPFPASTRVLVLDWNNLDRLDTVADLAVPVNPPRCPANNVSCTALLESVSVAHNNISEISSTAFNGLAALHSVRLNGNRIRRLPAGLFANNPNLGSLSVADNPIDSAGLAEALTSPLSVLRFIDLSWTAVASSSTLDRLPVTVFSRLPGLEHLVMRGASVENLTGDYFAALSGTSLMKLDLGKASFSDVNETAFQVIGESLDELVLDGAMIGTRQLENIFAGLSANTSRLETISLRDVFVSNRHESVVGHHLFRHLVNTRLKTLYMDRNYGGFGHGRVQEKLFHPLKHLVTLSLVECEIRSIPTDVFKGLHNLQTLNLRHNQLSCTRLSDCGFMTSPKAPSLTRLRKLDLADNQLSSPGGPDDVDGFRLAGDKVFPDLVELDLSDNRLTLVDSGTFGGHLSQLTHLKLSNNRRLVGVEWGAFSGLPSLSHLEMDGCRRLTHLRLGALSGLNRLRMLSIQDSGLVHVHHSVFGHLSHLEELYLRNNRLGEQGVSLEKVTSHGKLKIIDLGSNRLPTVPFGLLTRQSGLRSVFLDDNRLTNCSQLPATFQHSSGLEHLDLTGNLLSDLDRKCFDGLPVGVTIKLADNPVQCTCITADAVRWLSGVDGGSDRRPNTEDRDMVECVGPPSLSGVRPFAEPSSLPGAWQCGSRFGVVVTVVVLLFVVLVAATTYLAFRVDRLRRRRTPTAAVGSTPGSTCSLQHASSVTISNGCYGNGATGGAPAATSSGSGYSKLIEDDVIVIEDNRVRPSGHVVDAGPGNQLRSGPDRLIVKPGRNGRASNSSEMTDDGVGALRPLAVTNGIKRSPTDGARTGQSRVPAVDNEALLASCNVTDLEDSL